MERAASVTTPLLRRPGPGLPGPPPLPLSKTQLVAVHFFTALHLLRALGLFASPAQLLPSFTMPASSATQLLGSLLGSLLGGRDLLLAGLLIAAGRSGRAELHRALATALLSDAGDTFVLIFAAACAWHATAPVVETISLAVVAIGEHLALWSVGAHGRVADGEGELPRDGVNMKKRRLDSWLAEVREAEDGQIAERSSQEQPTATAKC